MSINDDFYCKYAFIYFAFVVIVVLGKVIIYVVNK